MLIPKDILQREIKRGDIVVKSDGEVLTVGRVMYMTNHKISIEFFYIKGVNSTREIIQTIKDAKVGVGFGHWYDGFADKATSHKKIFIISRKDEK